MLEHAGRTTETPVPPTLPCPKLSSQALYPLGGLLRTGGFLWLMQVPFVKFLGRLNQRRRLAETGFSPWEAKGGPHVSLSGGEVPALGAALPSVRKPAASHACPGDSLLSSSREPGFLPWA